jgi:hypothetical protein
MMRNIMSKLELKGARKRQMRCRSLLGRRSLASLAALFRKRCISEWHPVAFGLRLLRGIQVGDVTQSRIDSPVRLIATLHNLARCWIGTHTNCCLNH